MGKWTVYKHSSEEFEVTWLNEFNQPRSLMAKVIMESSSEYCLVHPAYGKRSVMKANITEFG